MAPLPLYGLDTIWTARHILSVATVIAGDFEWNGAKAQANVHNHGVSFEEAATVFADPLAVFLDDGSDEDRVAVVGLSADGRALWVVHVERGQRDRIISARRANATERALYNQR